jgi:hypothetical protein
MNDYLCVIFVGDSVKCRLSLAIGRDSELEGNAREIELNYRYENCARN